MERFFIFHISTDHYYITENTRMRLVLAYMRGGSTLTADIVRHTEADFYQFEPLHGITIAVQENRPVQFLNGTIRCVENLKSITNGSEPNPSFATCNILSKSKYEQLSLIFIITVIN